MEKKNTEPTPEEKRAARFEQWLSPSDVKFTGPEAEEGYKKRVTRFIKVLSLEEPDRVPLTLPAGNFPLYYAGITLKEAMYDNKKLCQAYQKFFNEFKADTFTSPGMVPPGKASEIINSIFARWPGHGLPDGATLQQFVEDEYMKANEYDILLKDPSDFCLRYYLPRMLGALEPFTHFSPLPYILGMPNRFLDPAVRLDFLRKNLPIEREYMSPI